MPPKKKGNKKAQNDDWEAELGESVAPQDGAASEPQPEYAAAADEDVAGGGLMAALAKRGKKKNKKGANLEVEGEDPPVDDANGDFDSKAPQEEPSTTMTTMYLLETTARRRVRVALLPRQRNPSRRRPPMMLRV